MKTFALFIALASVVLLPIAAQAVDIVVYDGTDGNNPVIAGCSDPDGFCLGANGVTPTGTVTHRWNNVGWGTGGTSGPKSIYLFIDGKLRDSAKFELMTWDTHRDAEGPHTLQGMSVDNFGVEQWSNPLVIEVVKPAATNRAK